MSRSREGKVVPLNSRNPQTGDEQNSDDGVALALDPPGLIQAERMLGYFPNSLKEYYRQALMEYKTVNKIGNQKLRDQIMEPEDQELREKSGSKRTDKRAPIERDTRLNLDDLKKWFGSKSSHQIGDAKFAFINRFTQKVLIEGGFEGFQVRYNKERTNYHRQALRDIFASGYLGESVAQVLDGTPPHILISSIQTVSGKELPTCVIICGGYFGGIAPVTLVFSEVPPLRHKDSGQYREEFFISLEKSKFPVVLRGYIIVTANEDAGNMPNRDVVNGKVVLTNEDVSISDDFLPYSRIVADARIDVTKNEQGDVSQYVVTIDTTEFPQEVSSKLEFRKMRRFDGASVGNASRRLLAFLVKGNRYLDTIAAKFGGSYH